MIALVFGLGGRATSIGSNVGKPKAPEGYPNEVTFCKRTFPFHKTDAANRQLYKHEHILIIVETDSAGEYEIGICPTSKEHHDRAVVMSSGPDIQKAVKRAEKDFQALYYKMKPLMER